MSIEMIRPELKRFLSSPDPEVLIIKGAWGIGNTYAWNDILSKANQSGELAFKKYSYGSLFGIDSLEKLK
jgi:hypothetical protein